VKVLYINHKYSIFLLSMFEHHHLPLLTKAAFILRMLRHGLIALGLVLCSLFIGIIGYHGLEGISWMDSVLNASMILGGMGPVNELHTVAGKLFASVYALFSGIVFLVIIGVFFAPLYHRFLHKFHLKMEQNPNKP